MTKTSNFIYKKRTKVERCFTFVLYFGQAFVIFILNL